ncbi:hypothetical protein [Methylocystis heyeri]|uniref:SPOR domain-containing protein n=1 Tax=Methylocystis heyeri TaxID=391905 RepID=A0A6B8KIQ9_9HYPH|nr:hypothetical protein [Methylocystis heyeri]QGM46410.1 hypothetical protein H2LOC_012285 [Methylocystis heyeri]
MQVRKTVDFDLKYAVLLAVCALCVTPAAANYGYCFTPGLMGGTKVFIHEAVREDEFWDGAVVKAYRSDLENARRFRFTALSCPSFDTESEAQEHLAATRTQFLRRGFTEFLYPMRPD